MQQDIEDARLTYLSLMENVAFDQIEHVPNEFLNDQIVVQDNCLCISHQYFADHYQKLMKELGKTEASQLQKNHWIAEILLAMNGENGNAWNYKKQMLDQKLLDIQRQLKFNAAVCYKNKKSSTYYDYRIRLYEEVIKSGRPKSELMSIYQSESKLIWKVLARFFRNYYCWMYRNRLFRMFQQVLGEEITQLEINLLHKFIETNPNDYSAYSRLIPIINNSPHASLLQEKEWIQSLEDFCVLAFEHKESFRHIETYKQFLGRVKCKQG